MKLLVGVDGKGYADHAVHAAAQLRRRLDAELALVHTVPVPPAMWIGIDKKMLAEMHASALGRAKGAVRERMTLREKEYGLEPGELTQVLDVVPGEAGKVLVERAAETSADLLFIGAHRRRGAFELGRTARAVLHAAPCGLWLQPCPYRPIASVLAPTDLSRHSLAAVNTARDLARRLEADLAVLHCFTPPNIAYTGEEATVLGWPDVDVEPIRDRARVEFDRALDNVDWGGLPVERIFGDGAPIDEILERQEATRLVVMGTHGHTGLAGLVLGHVTWSVLRKAEGPVLAVREPDRTL